MTIAGTSFRSPGLSPYANFGRIPPGGLKSSQNNARLKARGLVELPLRDRGNSFVGLGIHGSIENCKRLRRGYVVGVLRATMALSAAPVFLLAACANGSADSAPSSEVDAQIRDFLSAPPERPTWRSARNWMERKIWNDSDGVTVDIVCTLFSRNRAAAERWYVGLLMNRKDLNRKQAERAVVSAYQRSYC